MATYAEGSFDAGGYKFRVNVRDGWCPKSVYVYLTTDSYLNLESFSKRGIEKKPTSELESEIKDVAHKAAVNAHSNYRSTIKDGSEFEEKFVKGLEPIPIEGIDNFNGGKTAGNLQKIIAALKGK